MDPQPENILIIGSGGRENAMGWKFSQSSYVNKIYYAPGNGGTSINVQIQPFEFEKLVRFAKEHDCVTIVGPELPLADGIVDYFLDEDMPIFGPRKYCAKLESSKVFSKQFMKDNSILTPDFRIFSDSEKAKDYVINQGGNVVVKADGLASGKGVVVSRGIAEALDAIDRMMVKREFGTAGNKIVVEKKLSGEEVSFIVICDGNTFLPLASCRDHKRAYDGDSGPNTGGMGSFSPVPFFTSELTSRTLENIIEPTITGMRRYSDRFKGFLYAGLMIEKETRNPYVLEYNVRMGDPECQPLMVRMKSDFYLYIKHAIEGTLDTLGPIDWSETFSACVVMASKGYPGAHRDGRIIRGLDSDLNNVKIFHAGTTRDGQNRVITNGGRVLGITAQAQEASDALAHAYDAIHKISWGDNEQFYRNDIARSVLAP